MTEHSWTLVNGRYRSFSFSPEIKHAVARIKPDDITPLLIISKDWAIIIAAVVATVHGSWWLYPFAVVAIGVHQRGLTTIAHDAAHRTLARTAWWNYLLGITFASYPLFQKHWAYRVSHVHLHHRFLGNPDKDPDLRFFLASGAYEVCEPRKYFRKIVLWPLLGGATLRYLKYLLVNRFSVESEEAKRVDKTDLLIDSVGFFTFWLVLLAGSYALGAFDELVFFWVVPYLTSFQILGWFVELAEHTPMCESETQDVYLTRNRKGNWFERWLFGINYDEYHLEHHLTPSAPFYRLPEVQRIRTQDRTYAKIAEAWGGLVASGPEGQSSVIRQLLDRNRLLYERKRDDLGFDHRAEPYFRSKGSMGGWGR